MEVTITIEEAKAIKSLQRLSKKWPGTLSLFSWSGSMCVVKNKCVIDHISNIENDGGDPIEGDDIYDGSNVEIIEE